MRTGGPYHQSLQQLHAEAETLARQTERLQEAAARAVGSDATGRVSVTVDSHGRVVDVSIDPRWRDMIGVTRLPAAVRQAVEAAVLARLAAVDRALGKLLDTEESANEAVLGAERSGIEQATTTSDADRSSGEELVRTLPAMMTPGALVAAVREVLVMAQTLDWDTRRPRRCRGWSPADG